MTQALGDPIADIAETLRRLDLDVQSTVPSYLGMTVTITDDEPGEDHRDGDGPNPEYTFTAFRSPNQSAQVRSSLVVPLPGARVIVYAGRPGALVDLAADLAWLTGNKLGDYVLDAHLIPPAETDVAGTLSAMSTINQAIGVLIGRGRTREQAHADLDGLARAGATGPLGAARAFLASLATTSEQEPR